MEAPTIQLEKRTETGSKAAEKSKELGKVPGVIYGSDKKHYVIQADKIELEKIYEEVGESQLVNLQIGDNKPLKALIYEIQLDPLLREPIHVDFYVVDMKKKIQTEIELRFIGVSPAVKGLGGTLVKVRDEIEVEALPDNLVGEIKVDLSSLETFDDIIRLGDLEIPEGIEVLSDDNVTIAKVVAPRTEEELAALEEEVTEDVEGVEVEGEAEGEEDEAAESEIAEGEGEEDEEKKAEENQAE